MNLSDYRENYQRGELDRTTLSANPLDQFESWFRDATGEQSQSRWRKVSIALYKLWSAICNHRPPDVNAMTLATADKNGKPSTRTVLLKSMDERGFIFFTNYDSRKGLEMTENPNAALTFFWSELEQSRPRGSQIGAWASNQSEAIPDRASLQAKWRELEKRFPGEVPLPDNWGGFILKPERIEFWQGRPSRLHDRFSYVRLADGNWKMDRLAP
ncbi:MAG: pyridoxine 5'-phosphate oxidase C-terminal domain-containing protein [Verrucomicrobiota bacterium]